MGIVKFEMEMSKKPATRYVTYFVMPPPGKSAVLGMPASMNVLVDTLNIPGTESSMRANKKNKELLPRNIRVTIEWDEVPGQ